MIHPIFSVVSIFLISTLRIFASESIYLFRELVVRWASLGQQQCLEDLWQLSSHLSMDWFKLVIAVE